MMDSWIISIFKITTQKTNQTKSSLKNMTRKTSKKSIFKTIHRSKSHFIKMISQNIYFQIFSFTDGTEDISSNHKQSMTFYHMNQNQSQDCNKQYDKDSQHNDKDR